MARSIWRLIVSGALPGSLNMALDEVLLESLRQGRSAPLIRFYQWDRPTLSLGYAQSVGRSVNIDFCRNKGIGLVRRITGGRSVLHDDELTYAVISPEKNAIFPGGIQGNYRVIAEVLREALLRFGIPARLASGRGKVPVSTNDFRHSVCFHSPSLYELTVAGCKVTGSAQTRRHGYFLQHGSLPLGMDTKVLTGALSPSATDCDEENAFSLEETVGWINRFASRTVTADELRRILVEVIEMLWNVCLQDSEITASEMAEAVDLQRMRYDSDAWTFRR